MFDKDKELEATFEDIRRVNKVLGFCIFAKSKTKELISDESDQTDDNFRARAALALFECKLLIDTFEFDGCDVAHDSALLRTEFEEWYSKEKEES